MRKPRTFRRLLTDRRFLVIVLTETLLFILGYFKGIDVPDSMALTAIALAAANAGAEVVRAWKRPHKKVTQPPET